MLKLAFLVKLSTPLELSQFLKKFWPPKCGLNCDVDATDRLDVTDMLIILPTITYGLSLFLRDPLHRSKYNYLASNRGTAPISGDNPMLTWITLNTVLTNTQSMYMYQDSQDGTLMLQPGRLGYISDSNSHGHHEHDHQNHCCKPLLEHSHGRSKNTATQ